MDGLHLEHRVRKGGRCGHAPENSAEAQAELLLRQGPYLAYDAPPGGSRILGFGDGDPRGARSGPFGEQQRGLRRHLLRSPPGEGGFKPRGPGGSRGDQACGLAGHERDGPSARRGTTLDDAARGAYLRPQRAARSSVLASAWAATSRATSESSSLGAPAQAPTKPWKSGCGLKGRLLNSGWNWLPIKNG